MKTALIMSFLLLCIRTDCHIPEYATILSDVVFKAKSFDNIILDILLENGVEEELSQIILAQAKHESGNFTSNIFWENNNPFGMKCPRKRPTTCIGTNRGHGVFNSIEDAVIDYVWWMEFNNIPFNEKNTRKYVQLLKNKRYFEDDINRYYKAVIKFKETV